MKIRMATNILTNIPDINNNVYVLYFNVFVTFLQARYAEEINPKTASIKSIIIIINNF